MKLLKSRRLISVLTILCMVAALIVPMGMATVSATSTNLVSEISFSVSDWGSKTVALTEALEANTTYKWSFKFSLAGGSQNATVTIAGIEVFSGTGFNTNTVKSGEFTTGATAPTDTNIVFKSSGGGSFSVSELTVTKVEEIIEEPEVIENYATQTSCTVSDWGTVTIPLASALEADTTYKWSFKFSLAGGSQNATVTIAGMEVFSGTGFYTNNVKNGEFTTEDTVPTNTNIVFISSGGGSFSVSELTVTKVEEIIEEPEVTENYATQTSCTVSDWGTVTIPLASALEADTTYKWSFKFSLAGGSQKTTVTIAGIEVFSGTSFYTNNVKSGEFTTDATAPTDTNIIFKSNGGGSFQISDLIVKKIDYTAPTVLDYHTKNSFLKSSSNNMFLNGDFETTPTSGTGWNVSGFSDKASFSVDTSEKYNGSKSLKFTGTAEETELKLKFTAEPQTEYTFGAWVKGGYLSTEYSGSVKFGVVDNYGNFADFSADANTHDSCESYFTAFARDMKWHRVGFTFKTGNSEEIIFVIRGEKAIMWFDDIVISKSENCTENSTTSLTAPKAAWLQIISNPSCTDENNLIEEISFNNAEYWADTNICRSAVRVSKDPRNSANEVLLYEPTEYNTSNSYYSRGITVEKNTDYVFSAFYRSDVSSEAIFGLYYSTDWESPVLYSVGSSDVGSWKFVKYKFNTNDYDKLTFFIQDKGGNLILDDVRLFKATNGISLNTSSKLSEMNSALNSLVSFAPSGGAVVSNYASRKDYNVSNWAADSAELTALLEADTDYVWSFNVKDSNSTENFKLTLGGETAYYGKATNGLKTGLLKTGKTAPSGNFAEFSALNGGGEYSISDLTVTKLAIGDTDCNTTVADANDLVFLRKILLDIEEVRSDYSTDLNGDSAINIVDLVRLKKNSAS